MPAPILINNYDRSQLILGGRIFIENATYVDSGSGSTLAIGTVMGRIFSSGNVVPLNSTATDGSQMPVGILADTYVVGASATQVVDLLIRGDVNSLLVVLTHSGDTLNTTVMTEGVGGTIGDMIVRNTGIIIVPSTDLSNDDNQ